MKIQRKTRFLLPLLLLILIWKPLCVNGFGWLVRALLSFQKGWTLSYDSIEWEKGALLFSHARLYDQGGSSLEIPAVQIFLKRKEIQLEKPHLYLSSSFKLENSGTFSWTVIGRDGILEGDGVEPAHVSFSYFPDQTGLLSLDWKGGNLTVDSQREGEGLSLTWNLSQFSSRWAKRWVGERVQGRLTGQGQIAWERGEWRNCEGSLKVEEGEGDAFLKDLRGDLAWRLPSFRNWEGGRVRGAIQAASLVFPHSLMSRIEGEFTLLGNEGAKWELKGEFERQDVVWRGSVALKSRFEPWLESTFRHGSSSLTCQGILNKERLWSVEGKEMTPSFTLLLQDFIASSLMPEIEQGALLSGIYEGRVEIVEKEGKIEKWRVPHFRGIDMALRWKDATVSLESIGWGKGFFALEQGSFSVQLPHQTLLEGAEWKGEGNLEEGSLSLQGKIDDFLAHCSLKGSPSSFEGALSWTGRLNGEALLKGELGQEGLALQLHQGKIEQFEIEGEGTIRPDGEFALRSSHFQGPIESLALYEEDLKGMQGQLVSSGEGFWLIGSSKGLDWGLEARLEKGKVPLYSSLALNEIQMEIELSQASFSLYNVHGFVDAGLKIPFYAPIVQSNGSFDIRLEGETFHIGRLVGTMEKGKMGLDPLKSHLFDAPISLGSGHWQGGKIEEMRLKFDVPLSPLYSYFLGFHPFGPLQVEGKCEASFIYEQDKMVFHLKGDQLLIDQYPLDLDLTLRHLENGWRLDPSHVADLHLEGFFHPDLQGWHFSQGKSRWKHHSSAEIEGTFSSLDRWELRSHNMHLNLKELPSLWADISLEGILQGSGMMGPEALDFDFTLSEVKTSQISIESRTPLHFSYAKEKGIMVTGFDGSFLLSSHPIDCKIGLLHYDLEQNRWIFDRTSLHIPAGFSGLFKDPISTDLDCLVDIEAVSDFSSIDCKMQEGFFPYKGMIRHVKNCHLAFRDQQVLALFEYLLDGKWTHIRLDANIEHLRGRVTIEDALTVDWTFTDRLIIHDIEGQFGGSDFSFHADGGETLIGGARIDCKALFDFVPNAVKDVFTVLKMGAGYEVMGSLQLLDEGIVFKGLLTGKQFAFFDYQLKTLLAQIEITPEKVRIWDLKISDTAGTLTVDEIVAQGTKTAPWTLSIPRITVTELRPSLIQKIGEESGSLSPLVVRKMKLENLQGLLDESKTYTAKGELTFINSYKREHTVLDIPSDVLSRIVGLDLDLLIPVRGTLRYELKDGYFRLTELEGAYSENERSEFFLVYTDESPRMDLDGNLQILIKMKQFVLFKFTESFLISVDGTLNNPHFQLQKRRHFLGL